MTYLREGRSCRMTMTLAIVAAFCNGFKGPNERARASNLLRVRGTLVTILVYFLEVKGNARADFGLNRRDDLNRLTPWCS